MALLALAAALCFASGGANSAQGQEDAAASDRLILLDGSALQARGLNIHEGAIGGDGVPSGLELNDLRRIERPEASPAPASPAAQWIELHGGSRIAVQNVSIAKDKCRFQWLGEQTLELPLDAVRSLRLQSNANGEFDKARANPSVEQDRVLVRDDAGTQTIVSGLVESLTSEQLQLDAAGQARNLPLANIAGIVFAQPAAGESLFPITMHFGDDSLLIGRTLELSGSIASLLLPGDRRVAFRWSEVDRVTVRSERVAFLSDLQPIAERQRPIVTAEFPARRDQNVLGHPLRLGSQAFEKGLGVHAFSELTFATGGQWDRFMATIGLDPDAGEKGDCVFKVLTDGDVVLARRIRAEDAPEVVNLPISGREQVTLVVEPGDELDLGDHANWCDARFIKSKP